MINNFRNFGGLEAIELEIPPAFIIDHLEEEERPQNPRRPLYIDDKRPESVPNQENDRGSVEIDYTL